jgi:hypothetical protein
VPCGTTGLSLTVTGVDKDPRNESPFCARLVSIA